jgi:hypothetical protein
MASPKLQKQVVEIEGTKENRTDIRFRMHYIINSLTNYVGFQDVSFGKPPTYIQSLYTSQKDLKSPVNSMNVNLRRTYTTNFLEILQSVW